MDSDIKQKTQAQISEDLYSDYRSSQRTSWGEQVQDDRAFALGAQLEQEDSDALENANQYTGAVNEITPSIDLVVAMLTENNPRFQFVGSEKSDAKIAADVSDLHYHIWDNSNGTQILEKAVYDFEEGGMGALMAYPDYHADLGKGEIKITDLEILDLYIDPKSKKPDCSDAEHIMIVKNLSEGQIKSLIPNFKFEGVAQISADQYPEPTRAMNEDQVLSTDDSIEEVRYRVIDRYTKIKVKRFNVYDPISDFENILDREDYQEYLQKPAFIIIKQGQESYETREVKIRELRGIYEQTGGTFHYMINPLTQQAELMAGAEHGETSVPASTTMLQPTTIGELVNMGVIKVSEPLITRIRRVYTIGNKLVLDEILPLEDYPIVTFMLHHKRNPFPMSDIRLVKPLQEQLNKIMSLILAYNTNITNVKYFVPIGSKTKKELEERGGKAGSQVFEYDPELGGQPIVVQLTQMSQALYEEKRQIQEQIQRIIGAYAVMDGSAVQAPTTKGGTVLIDEYGQRRINLKRKRLEGALNSLAKVISQMIPKVYTEEKIVRILEPNKKIKQTVFNQQDPENANRIVNDLSIRYDVRVVSGSTMPTNKMQRAEMMMNLYNNRIITDPSLVIQYLDIPDVDDVIERENRLRQYEQQLAQAEEQIKALSGQLQTKSREVIQANEKVEVEKFKGNLNKISNKAESAVLLGTQRINDEVKNKRKEQSERTKKPERD